MCGIIGIVGTSPVAPELYTGLILLQHRGQDVAGIVTYDSNELHLKKGEGLVTDVFDEKDMHRLSGNIGIGHVRYPTAGTGGIEEAQPFMINYPFGITIAHNGNILNFDSLKKELLEKEKRFVNSKSDSELILHVLASALEKTKSSPLKPEDVWKAVSYLYEKVQGAYALVIYIAGQGMLAIRDQYGIKPLVWGKRNNSLVPEYMFASESVALDGLGFEKIRDLENGEAIFINNKNEVFTKKFSKKPFRPCMFEYIYFARPDSIIDNVSVYKARVRLGETLATQIKKSKKDKQIDTIVPVPESARSAALALSSKIGIKYREGLTKNRYIGRTFIMPGQKMRQASIKRKLNAQPLIIKDRNVLLVDDSIVRGNTSKQIVQMLKNAGAKKVYFASSAPAIRFPCFYGIDFPTRKELIGYGRKTEEIANLIEVDTLFYQTLSDTEKAVKVKSKIEKPCMACFDGEYPTGGITEKTFREMEQQREDSRAEMERKEKEEKEDTKGFGMF